MQAAEIFIATNVNDSDLNGKQLERNPVISKWQRQ